MDKPVEILLFEFLSDQIALAVPEDVLYEAELHDTVYQAITRPRGIRISDAVGDLSPEPGGGMKEWNVSLQICCFSKIEGRDKKARMPALMDVFAIEQKMFELLLGDQTLGGRVCDTLLKKGVRGYDTLNGNPYAIANISLIVNPDGSAGY